MKIRIPKHMRGVSNPHVLTINLQNFDIDHFLPSLYFAVLADGAQQGRRSNDPTLLSNYIRQLATQPDLEGFDGVDGIRLLDRVVRASLVVLGHKGRSRGQEQILAVTPYSLLASKPGFPTERTRQRGVDAFLYQSLLSAIGLGSDRQNQDMLRSQFKNIFGQGVKIASSGYIDGYFDGVTPLDTLTRLSLAFLNTFAPTPIGRKSAQRPPQASCPRLYAQLGRDILDYLFAYGNLMPPDALIHNLKALINFELFIYTLKVIHAINALVDDCEHLPPAMGEMIATPPELYIDFTRTARSLSLQIASSCVRRDIEAYQRFLTSNLLLRQLDVYVGQLRRLPARAKRIDDVLDGATEGPRYLQGLLRLMVDDEIGSRLENKADDDESLIRQLYTNENGEDEADLAVLDDIIGDTRSSLERLIAILSEGQGKQVLANYMKWFWHVGGLTQPHGILMGTPNVRRSWRYAPSNDLLAVLVQLAAIQSGGESHGVRQGGATRPQPVRLRDFLQYLEQRFGILIDRPPSSFTGADAAAAARENLRAMLGRLRQMGIFSDLSDDFTVQQLQPPYAEERRASHRS